MVCLIITTTPIGLYFRCQGQAYRPLRRSFWVANRQNPHPAQQYTSSTTPLSDTPDSKRGVLKHYFALGRHRIISMQKVPQID
ncbi:hypothetical protein LJC28_01665 [Dysgonomonas sp. OttesenSCG-928-D17]|nr:hypothetical protein [Dysgonomonas sp. OttesenSCG-928-D17]